MTILKSIMLFLLMVIVDYLFNRIPLLNETLDFFTIVPTVVLFVRKDKVGCIFFLVTGLFQDAYSTGFFGIHSLAFFISSLHLTWLSKKVPGESPLLIFLFGLAAQLIIEAYVILFFFMAERLNFVTPYLYHRFVFSILPSAAMTAVMFYSLKNVLRFFSIKSTAL